ncbi:MAG: OmpA family protein [Deltaproteobacteria bacterium]
MGPFYRDRFHVGLLSCLAVILFLFPSASIYADECKRVQNILVLFDASGFMKERGRYQRLLKQMRFFEEAMPLTADGFFDVGLRHYGLKVGLGCNNTQSILAIQPWDPERFINAFPRSVSYGVSALSAGLRAAADEIAAAPGKGVIVLIGGGIESCKADPIKIADRIAYNNPDLEIHTFQVGNSQEGRFFLKAIAEKCNGTYHNVKDITSPAGWHDWMKSHLLIPCGPTVPQQGGGVPAPQVSPITFDFNSFSVRSKNPAADAANRASLEAVARFLQENPSARVVLHGYTDGKGKQAYNLKLSRRRAEAVARYLTGTYGIPASRIGIIAHGVGRDVARSPGPMGERERRRVEFELFR